MHMKMLIKQFHWHQAQREPTIMALFCCAIKTIWHFLTDSCHSTTCCHLFGTLDGVVPGCVGLVEIWAPLRCPWERSSDSECLMFWQRLIGNNCPTPQPCFKINQNCSWLFMTVQDCSDCSIMFMMFHDCSRFFKILQKYSKLYEIFHCWRLFRTV